MSNSTNPVVEVTIAVDKKGEIISVSPDPFIVRKLKDQMVRWICSKPKQKFSIEFENGSPFHDSQFSKDYPCSGLVRRGVVTDRKRIYKYSVRVGNKVLDPGGGVDK